MRTVRIKNSVVREGRFIRQDGEPGRFAILKVLFEPTSSVQVQIVWDVPDDSVPEHFSAPAISAIGECFGRDGPYNGATLVNTRVTFLDGAYHAIDSSQLCYKIAASIALRDAILAEGEFSEA